MNYKELIETIADYLQTKKIDKQNGVEDNLNIDEQLLILNYLIMIVLSKRDKEIAEKQFQKNKDEAKKILEKKESENKK
jgi:hypothetical protein